MPNLSVGCQLEMKDAKLWVENINSAQMLKWSLNLLVLMTL